MNKTITIAGAVVAGVALPLLGMTITPAREAIISLTTSDEKILALADKIDEQRTAAEQVKAESDQKINELQSQISTQQQLADEQKKMIEEQEKQNEENKKAIECAELYSKYSLCNNKERYKKTLSSFLSEYIADQTSTNTPEEEIKEWKERGTKNWNTCQDVYKQCE